MTDTPKNHSNLNRGHISEVESFGAPADCAAGELLQQHIRQDGELDIATTGLIERLRMCATECQMPNACVVGQTVESALDTTRVTVSDPMPDYNAANADELTSIVRLGRGLAAAGLAVAATFLTVSTVRRRVS